MVTKKNENNTQVFSDWINPEHSFLIGWAAGWQARMIYQVGVWYYEHLAGQKPIGKLKMTTYFYIFLNSDLKNMIIVV
jgi:hypothetical protein